MAERPGRGRCRGAEAVPTQDCSRSRISTPRNQGHQRPSDSLEVDEGIVFIHKLLQLLFVLLCSDELVEDPVIKFSIIVQMILSINFSHFILK